MKSLLVLFVAVGVSQAAVTCDECRATAQDLVSHMLSEENLAEQVQIMKDNVCPQVTHKKSKAHLIFSQLVTVSFPALLTRST